MLSHYISSWRDSIYVFTMIVNLEFQVAHYLLSYFQNICKILLYFLTKFLINLLITQAYYLYKIKLELQQMVITISQ